MAAPGEPLLTRVPPHIVDAEPAGRRAVAAEEVDGRRVLAPPNGRDPIPQNSGVEAPAGFGRDDGER